MAAKKSVKKYQNGGNTGTSKTRTVTKSPDGMYKTVTNSGPLGTVAKTRRTIKGVMSGAAKPMKDIVVKPTRTGPPDTGQPKIKKGGSVKRKK